MKNKISFLFFFVLFGLLCKSEASDDIHSVTVIYDSRYHVLSSVPQNFSVKKYDVSLTSRIEAQINKRLVYSGPKTTIEGVESWAREKAKQDPELKQLFDMLPSSYDYLVPVSEFSLTKVPAVIAHIGADNFVVYGETNINKALQTINSSRHSKR